MRDESLGNMPAVTPAISGRCYGLRDCLSLPTTTRNTAGCRDDINTIERTNTCFSPYLDGMPAACTVLYLPVRRYIDSCTSSHQQPRPSRHLGTNQKHALVSLSRATCILRSASMLACMSRGWRDMARLNAERKHSIPSISTRLLCRSCELLRPFYTFACRLLEALPLVLTSCLSPYVVHST